MTNIVKPVAGSIPTGCNDLQTLRWTLSGFYTVKGSANKVNTVYCNFTKASGVKGLLHYSIEWYFICKIFLNCLSFAIWFNILRLRFRSNLCIFFSKVQLLYSHFINTKVSFSNFLQQFQINYIFYWEFITLKNLMKVYFSSWSILNFSNCIAYLSH